jgi:hypothetical protein
MTHNGHDLTGGNIKGDVPPAFDYRAGDAKRNSFRGVNRLDAVGGPGCL